MTATAPGSRLHSDAPQDIRVDAGGTAWRLRSLIAMGHDCARIARALRVSTTIVRRVVNGETGSVTPEFRDLACQLWTAWWDKTPPQRTTAQRRAAAAALGMAKQRNWPAAAGLDEDLLDEPSYRPWSRYRPAAGTGEAAEFTPAHVTDKHTRTAAPLLRRQAS